jgi:hypothetical protein
MSVLFGLLCTVVALGLSVALLGFALVTLGFSGESYRSGMSSLHIAFNTVAVLFALAPFVLTLWVSWRRFISSNPWEAVPLGWGLPFVALVTCAVACFLAFLGGEWVASLQSEKRRAQERAALRAEVEGGAQEKVCDLVLLDPMATPEDMRRCRARLESLTAPGARWAELTKFLGSNTGFKTWNPKQLGLAPKWDWNRSLVAVRHDQAWFLPMFFETWLARPEAFQSEKDLDQLNGLLRSSQREDGWAPAAVDALRARVLPEIVRRFEAQQAVPQDVHVMDWLRKALSELQQTPGDAGEPTPPTPAGTPPDAIGLARIGDDGDLRLWLRTTPSAGAFGDVFLRYSPSNEHFRHWKRHLGSMEPGEVRPVEPLAD